jgi:pectinesterase
MNSLAKYLGIAALALTAATALAVQRTLVVAADGSGQFKTVQAAVDAAPDGNVRIDIKPGEYREVLHIAANDIKLHGTGKNPADVLLIYDNSAGTAGGTNRSGSVNVTGDDFVAENLTIANDFEKRHGRTNQGSQAVALMITGDREVLRHVRLLGYQDTLYANSKTCHNVGDTGPCRASRQLYQDCYIEGHVDFIFGDAKAVFDRCEIHAMAHPVVTITAQSRVRPDEDSGYLFLHCTVTADPAVQSLLLGRPWRAYSRVVWIDTDFRAKLDPRAWIEWGGRLGTSDYEEYGSHGEPGDIAQRADPSRQLTAAEAAQDTIRNWLAGDDNWNPEKVH